MKTIPLLLFCLIASFSSGCDGSTPVPNIPEKKSSFQKIVFTEPQRGGTITLISETECEMNHGSNIVLAEYSRQDNKLRVVLRGIDGAKVHYFEILPDGLREPSSGEVLLLPEPLIKYREQMRIAQEAEAARQRAVQEAKAAEQERQRQKEAQQAAELTERLTERRDAIMQDIRTFLSKGTVFKGTYYSLWDYQHKNPNLPYQITITGNLTNKDFGYEEDHNLMDPGYDRHPSDPLDQEFGIPAHFKWLGDTETLSPSSWGMQIKEYDGMIIGAIKIQNKTGMNPVWRVTIKYCINGDPGYSRGWRSREGGSIWNGTQFEGKSKSAISLPVPRTASPKLAVPAPAETVAAPLANLRAKAESGDAASQYELGQKESGFLGEWTNRDFQTLGIKRIRISLARGTRRIVVRIWTKSSQPSGEWDNGEVNAVLGNQVLSVPRSSLGDVDKLEMTLLRNGEMQVEAHPRFSGRESVDHTSGNYIFRKVAALEK